MNSWKKDLDRVGEAARAVSAAEDRGGTKTLLEVLPRVGRVFAEEFTVLRRIGYGSFGTVYLVTDSSGKELALKVLMPDLVDDPVSSMRFRREADICEATRNVAGLVPYVAHGEYFEVPYIVLGYVPGINLEKGWKSTTLIQMLETLSRVARILHKLHERGIVHRDVKFSNVMRSDDGKVFVIDFGVASAPDSITRMRSLERNLVGTIGCMSPEQAAMEPADARDDQWSLGVMVLAAVMKRRGTLFGAKTEQEILDKTRAREYSVPPLKCSKELKELIQRALAPHRGDRYPSMLDLADAIQSAIKAEAASKSKNV